MPKRMKVFAIILISIFMFSNIAFAGGLSTKFAEVKLKDLEPGKTYSVEKETYRALVIDNTTEANTVDILIEPEMPVDYNLVPGYEPIPELSWVTIEKNTFKDIAPGQSAKTDILISIPNQDMHKGKKYQVYIYSHTTGKAMFRVGLMSRILIEIKE